MQILRLLDGKNETATVIDLSKEMARDEIDRLWWTAPNLSADTTMEQDRHWSWERIAVASIIDSLHACVALRSEQGYMEGAMAYQFNAMSVLEPNCVAAYISRLATAPRNRDYLTNGPLYKGIGSALLYSAVRESYLNGLGGRIVLQSLPNQRTLEFYEHKGFIRTDLTQPSTGLIDYELPEAAALSWLRKSGDLA